MTDDCLFCRIVRGEIPAKVIAQNETCIAFRDVEPEAPVHVLVIPREHVRSLNEVARPALVAELMELVRTVVNDAGIESSGYRVVFNTNSDGGQTIAHLHAHVLGGRHMAWPPG